MSLEEKLAKAKELQERARKKRELEEKKYKEENEKARIESTKLLQENKRKMEEQQAKLDMDRQKKEKQEFLDAKQKMLDELRRDKEERFGKSIPGQSTQAAAKPTGPEKTPLEKVDGGIKLVTDVYTEDRSPGVAKTCLGTIRLYLSNVVKDPSEEKFRRINLANENFQKRVGKVTGGLIILKGVGFEEHPDGTLFLASPDVDLVKQVISKLEQKLG